MIEIPLNKRSRIPLYKQIASYLQQLIESGVLPKGTRLPAEREFADFLGISRTTIIKAYELLSSRGILEIKPKSGVYVKVDKQPQKITLKSEVKIKYNMADELPDENLILKKALLPSFYKQLIKAEQYNLLYPTPPQGDPQTIRTVQQFLSLRGIITQQENIIIVNGVQQGLSIVFRLFSKLKPTVWLEELCYPEVKKLATSLGMNVKKLPIEETKLVSTISKHAKCDDIVYVMPNIQNPTARSFSIDTRNYLIKLSQRIGFYIVEDDTFGELKYKGNRLPALKTIDKNDKVIYIGSPLQLIAPGIKFGYIVAPTKYINQLISIKKASDSYTPTLIQKITEKLIIEKHIEKHLKETRNILQKRMETLTQLLENLLPEFEFTKPAGGIYLYVKTKNITGNKLAETCLRMGLKVTPASYYHIYQQDVNGIRLTFSLVKPSQIEEAVNILKEAYNKAIT